MTRTESTDWLYGTIATYGAGDLISDCVRSYGEWARLEVEFICKYLLPRQGTFVDAGAFIGTHTIPFALHVGADGKGISFEPNSFSFSLLSTNLQLAGLENVTAYNTAATESSGIAFSLFSEPGNHGHTALHRVDASVKPSDTDSLQCLGQAIDDLHLGHVDLIKADVEGMERSVLGGCLKLIEDCKPNIFLELNSLEEHAFVFELAKQFGYAVYGVRTLAFNFSNYKNNLANDTLGEGAELAIVLTTQKLPSIGTNPGETLIVQMLHDLDELALFLLSKPQYRDRQQQGLLPKLLGIPDYLSTVSISAEKREAQENCSQLKEQLNDALENERQAREETARVQSLANKATSESSDQSAT